MATDDFSASGTNKLSLGSRLKLCFNSTCPLRRHFMPDTATGYGLTDISPNVFSIPSRANSSARSL